MHRRKVLYLLTLALLIIATFASLTALGPQGASAATTGGQYLEVYPGAAVMLCYPYLIADHGIYDVLTGSYSELWPAYTALSAACSAGYGTVVTTGGVYMVTNNSVSWTVFVSPTQVIGVQPGYAAIDLGNSTAAVVGPGGGTDTIALQVNSTPAWLALLGQTPAIISTSRVDHHVVYVNTPSSQLSLNLNANVTAVAFGSGGLLVAWNLSGSYGLSIYWLSTTPQLSAVLARSWPLPLPLTKVYEVLGNYSSGYMVVVGSSRNYTVVYLLEPSHGSASLQFIGDAMPTPVGYYADGYTYVFVNGSWLPVPGYAFALISGSAALTTYGGGTYIYPFRPVTFKLSVPLSGYLEVGSLLFYVGLAPSLYELPAGSALRSAGGVALSIEPPITYYPSALTTPSLSSVAIVISGQERPVTSISGVLSVASGDGALLAITPSQAIIYSPELPGLEVTIPGYWTAGGIGGPYVALYSATAGLVYIYTLSGTQVTSYSVAGAAWPAKMYYIGTFIQTGVPYVVAEWGTPGSLMTLSEVGPSGPVVSSVGNATEYDYSTGLSASLTGTRSLAIRVGNLSVGIPIYGTSFYVNGLAVSAEQSPYSYYLVNLSSGSVTTLVVPLDYQVLPLPDDQVALFNQSSGIVNIYSLGDLMDQLPVIVVLGPPESEVAVNGTVIGRPPAVVYAPYFTTLNVSVIIGRSDEYSLVTVTSQYQEVNLTPPALAKLVFRVSSPIPVTTFTVFINGTKYVASNGFSVNVTPGFTYLVQESGFAPYYDCMPAGAMITPSIGIQYIDVSCSLIRPVLYITSNATANVTVLGPGGFHEEVNVSPLAPRYLVVPAGMLELRASAVGYFNLTKYINASSPSVYNVSLAMVPVPVVTTTTTAPPPRPTKGYLTITSNVPTASIVITYLNGTTAAIGTGRLTAALPPGTYAVTVSSPGYRTKTMTVTLSAGASSSYTAVLTRQSHAMPAYVWAIVAVVVIGGGVGAWFLIRRRGILTGGPPEI